METLRIILAAIGVVLQLIVLCTLCVSIYINADLRQRINELEQKLKKLKEDIYGRER